LQAIVTRAGQTRVKSQIVGRIDTASRRYSPTSRILPEQKLGGIVGETNRASQNHVGDPRMFRQFDGRRSLGGQVAEDTQRVDSASMISKKSGDEALLGADTVLARVISQGKLFHARVAAFDRIDVRLNFACSNERHIHAKAFLHGAARLIESHNRKLPVVVRFQARTI
jgi:hypothetical protein